MRNKLGRPAGSVQLLCDRFHFCLITCLYMCEEQWQSLNALNSYIKHGCYML